jgi:hypothetical protein
VFDSVELNDNEWFDYDEKVGYLLSFAANCLTYLSFLGCSAGERFKNRRRVESSTKIITRSRYCGRISELAFASTH